LEQSVSRVGQKWSLRSIGPGQIIYVSYSMNPKAKARVKVDDALVAAHWMVQDSLPAGQLALWRAESDDWLRPKSEIRPLGLKDKRRGAPSTPDRHRRVETVAMKVFMYDEEIRYERLNLGIFWLKDEAFEDTVNLTAPGGTAGSGVADQETTLERFAAVAEDLVQ
jgi:hypothetical protein